VPTALALRAAAHQSQHAGEGCSRARRCHHPSQRGLFDMNAQTQFQRCLPAWALLLTFSIAGCGGGLGPEPAPLPNGDTVGAPLAAPEPATPGMGLLEPVLRSTALALAAPSPAAEEVAGVWVREQAEAEAAAAEETAGTDTSPDSAPGATPDAAPHAAPDASRPATPHTNPHASADPTPAATPAVPDAAQPVTPEAAGRA